MKSIKKVAETEPVAVVGSIVTAGTAVLGALVTQGIVHLTADQIAAWLAAGTAVLSLPVTLLVRSIVTPIANEIHEHDPIVVPEPLALPAAPNQ